ncbi:hypothetical protein D3C72_2388870 [compost metagenome]
MIAISARSDFHNRAWTPAVTSSGLTSRTAIMSRSSVIPLADNHKRTFCFVEMNDQRSTLNNAPSGGISESFKVAGEPIWALSQTMPG